MNATVTTTYELDLETVKRVLAEFCGAKEPVEIQFDYAWRGNAYDGEQVVKRVKLVAKETR